MDGLQGEGYRVLGVSIDGPAPLGLIHFDLRSGMSVLYGLNGAGKSRLISAITQTLAGHCVAGGRGVVHVQVDDTDAEAGTDFPGALLDGLRVGALREEFAFADAETATAAPLGTFAQIVKHHLTRVDYDWDAMSAVVGDAAKHGYFSLEAVGRHQPLWEISISDRARTGSPLEGAYRAMAPLARSYRDLLDRAKEGDRSAGLVQEMIDLTKMMESLSPWGPGHVALGDLTRDHSVARPSWVPLELTRVGPTDVGPVDLIKLDGRADHNAETVRLLAAQRTPLLDEPGSGQLNDEAQDLLRDLETTATQSLRSMLGSGFTLRFQLGTPEDWFRGSTPIWVCDDEYSAGVPIEAMSAPRRRWAAAAIGLAVTDGSDDGAPSIVVVDEPESGIHRTAEPQVVAGLTQLTGGRDRAGIVATHSPAFLAHPKANLVHVRRNPHGATELVALRGLPQDEELGLTRADLLSLRRVFVLVEGEHDRIVLSNLFTSELEEAFAEILVLRGAKRAIAAAHAEWLLGATDAPLLVVLDKLGADTVRGWDEARAHFSAGRTEQAIESVRALRAVRRDEAAFLAKLGEEAVRTGTFHRLRFFGLGEDDVLKYLESYDDLLASKAAGTLRPEQVKRAALRMDTIHPDLTDLIAEIRRLSASFGGAAR